jgi:glycosyltransferase involved in cell wall biosynthesis
LHRLPKVSNIKVCHLSSVHFALDTRIFYKMCRFLAQKYDVSLIAVHPKEEILENVHVIPFRRFHNRQVRVAVGWFLMFMKACRVNAKIYHLHDPELIPCGLLLRLIGKKVILDIHENIAEDIFDKPWIKHQQRAYGIFHFFEKLACRHFYIILAETSYEKRYKLLARRWSTVLNYCDVDFFSPYAKNGYAHEMNLYYIGIILENRGILQIIEAMRLLQLEGYDPHFHCVGELYSDLARKIRNLSYYEEVRANLHFYGRMPLEEGYEMAPKMDIGLCIIWPMKNSMESYPTKLFEYMSVGLPIITSGFDLYRQVVEGNSCGVCVDPLNPADLKNAIKTMHMDVKKSELMAKNGKIAVKNFYNWESQKPILSKVYEELGSKVK